MCPVVCVLCSSLSVRAQKATEETPQSFLSLKKHFFRHIHSKFVSLNTTVSSLIWHAGSVVKAFETLCCLKDSWAMLYLNEGIYTHMHTILCVPEVRCWIPQSELFLLLEARRL